MNAKKRFQVIFNYLGLSESQLILTVWAYDNVHGISEATKKLVSVVLKPADFEFTAVEEISDEEGEG